MSVAPLPYVHDGRIFGGPEVWLLDNFASNPTPGFVHRLSGGFRARYGAYGPGAGVGTSGGLIHQAAVVNDTVWILAEESASALYPRFFDFTSAGSPVQDTNLTKPRGVAFDGTYVWVTNFGTPFVIVPFYQRGSGSHIAIFDTFGSHVADIGNGNPTTGNIWEATDIVYSGGSMFVQTNDSDFSVPGSNTITKWDASLQSYTGIFAGPSNVLGQLVGVDNAGTAELWSYSGGSTPTAYRWRVSDGALLGNFTLPAGESAVAAACQVTMPGGGSEVWFYNPDVTKTIVRTTTDGTHLGYFTVASIVSPQGLVTLPY